jgi:hypothetical protein
VKIDAASLTEYREAVNDYEVAFDVAEKDARRLRDSTFTDAERHRLDTAKQLLTVAIDEAATPAERQLAYRRVRQELDGLISLSDEAVEVLEKKVALQLTPGPVPPQPTQTPSTQAPPPQGAPTQRPSAQAPSTPPSAQGAPTHGSSTQPPRDTTGTPGRPNTSATPPPTSPRMAPPPKPWASPPRPGPANNPWPVPSRGTKPPAT